MNVFVTGGTGFIGRALCRELVRRGHTVTSFSRRLDDSLAAEGISCISGDILNAESYAPHLCGIDVVVHTAALAHVTTSSRKQKAAEADYIQINSAATGILAQTAAAAKVKRFVFISSIGVNGAQTSDVPFNEDSPVGPVSPYGVSKLEAERALQQVTDASGLDITIIRPPLVYWDNAPGNFSKLQKLTCLPFPLPFLGVSNKRSFIALPNLVDLIICACGHPAARNQLFLASDQFDLSTIEAMRLMAIGSGKKLRLFAVPMAALHTVFTAIGLSATFEQAFGTLQVDSSKASRLLGWYPIIRADEAFMSVGEMLAQRTQGK